MKTDYDTDPASNFQAAIDWRDNCTRYLKRKLLGFRYLVSG